MEAVTETHREAHRRHMYEAHGMRTLMVKCLVDTQHTIFLDTLTY
jgi:hypothetical protein